MNILHSIIPSAYKHHIVAILRRISALYPGTRLSEAINELSDFLARYASITPARLAVIYAFSSIEQEAVQLITKVYLAVLEMRGFNTKNISTTQLEYLGSVVLKLLRQAPQAGADYKAFCKKNGHLYTDKSTHLRLNNELMDAYFLHLSKNIRYFKEPLIHEVLKILVAHRLLSIKDNNYDFNNFKYLFIFLMLKLHAKVNISEFLNSLVKNKVDPGQLREALNILVTETWPKALEDALLARSQIENMAQELMAKNDASVIRDVIAVFEKLQPVSNEVVIDTQTMPANQDANVLRFTQPAPRKINSREILREAFRL